MCDPKKGPSLNILECEKCGEENEIFTDEERVDCEGCGAEIVNRYYHVHEPIQCDPLKV